MENIDSNEESDHDLISTDMLEDICDGSQTHPNVNKRETCCKICDCIKQRKCPEVTYTPYATSSREQTGDVITFAQFEEGNILTETRNDAESGDKSDNE